MPSQDRRSSRWCCKARAHSLASFHQDIVPSDVSRFHLRRRASPLLVPEDNAESRHDRALLHHILKDQQSRHRGPNVLNVHHRDGEILRDIERTQQSEAAPFKLPQIAEPGSQAQRHKGISNGMLLKTDWPSLDHTNDCNCNCCCVEDFVVPLELPAIDPQQVSLPPASEGVAPAAEGVAPAEALTEEEQKKLESVGWRMLNLPLIVCHSANGMPFFFPLQKVSRTLPSFPFTALHPKSHTATNTQSCSIAAVQGLHNSTRLVRKWCSVLGRM